jgi:hypothetical protein
MRIRMWLAPLVLLLAASCTSKPAASVTPPFDTTISVKDLMANLVDPTADGVWDSVGTIYTKEGAFEKMPQSDDEWNAVKAKAITLVEVGNLLMLPSRSGGNDDWIKLSQALIAQSKRAIAAAEAHDKDGVFNTGADIYEACVNCHKQFDPAITSVK